MSEKIELGLDLKDSVAKAGELASNLTRVKDAAKAVADAYELVADGQAAQIASPAPAPDWLDAIAKGDVGLKPIENSLPKVTEFQAALERLDRVLQTVDDDELAFVNDSKLFADSMLAEASAAKTAATAVDTLGAAGSRAANAHAAVGKSAGESNRRLGDLSRGALQASQALQDVAQGGIASALNNVDGIIGSLGRGMGLSAGAATVLSGGLLAVGTAALVAGPALKGWFDDWLHGANEIPKARGELDQFTAAIKANSEWMAEASASGKVRDADLEEYNRRLRENAELERNAGEAKKAKANLEKLAGLQTKEAAEDARLAAEALQGEMAGQTDGLVAAVASQMTRKSEELRNIEASFQAISRAHDAASESGDRAAASAAMRRMTRIGDDRSAAMAAIASDAANAVADAVLKGDERAIKTIAETLAGSGSEFAKTFEDRSRRFAEAALDRKAWALATRDYVEAAERKIQEAGSKIREAASDLVPDDVADAAIDKVGKAGRKLADELARLGDDAFARDPEAVAMAARDRVDAIARGVADGVKNVEKQADDARARINAALAKIGPDPFEGVESFEDLAMAFDDDGNRVELPRERETRMAEEFELRGVRRRSSLRKPVRQVAESMGIDLDPAMLEQAANMVDFGEGRGMSQGDAIAAALEQLMMNQQMMADQQNQDGGRIDRVRQGASRVRSILEYGQW